MATNRDSNEALLDWLAHVLEKRKREKYDACFDCALCSTTLSNDKA